MKSFRVGVADDQAMYLKSLVMVINTFDLFEVSIEAVNGKDMLKKLGAAVFLPDVILIDVGMQITDSLGPALKISHQYPLIKVVALSFNDKTSSIINMISANCCAYLLKDIHPALLEKALAEIMTKGYCSDDEYHRIGADPRRRLVSGSGCNYARN